MFSDSPTEKADNPTCNKVPFYRVLNLIIASKNDF